MSMRDEAVRSLPKPPRTADWTDLPSQAWDDIGEAARLAWDAWTSLFPELGFWDPFGAALTLSLLVCVVVWLLRVRPG